jgi:hypothetical protein
MPPKTGHRDARWRNAQRMYITHSDRERTGGPAQHYGFGSNSVREGSNGFRRRGQCRICPPRKVNAFYTSHVDGR